MPLWILFFLSFQFAFGGISSDTVSKRKLPQKDRIVVSPNQKHFIFKASGQIFRPWGMNYGHYGVIVKDFTDPVWDTVKSDFRKMKAMGANSVRVTLEYDLVMQSPQEANPKALRGYRHLIDIAGQAGLYLDVTGLAGYRPAYRKRWYDTLSEEKRWEAQAKFWKVVAQAGKNSSSVFCYDLMNEPVVFSKSGKSWYTGHLGEYDFCQYLSLDAKNRSKKEVAYLWTQKMTSAIRTSDKKTLISIGFATWSNAVFDTVSSLLDFMCAHIYPESEDLEKADRQLQHYKIGLPILVEETFPLRCDTAELARFMRRNKESVQGWYGHYLMPYSLREMQRMNSLTLKEAIYRDWLEMFVRMGEDFTPQTTLR